MLKIGKVVDDDFTVRRKQLAQRYGNLPQAQSMLHGIAAVGCGLLFAMAFLGDTFTWPSSGPWWMWLGGVFGVVFILTSAWAVPRLGVLVTMLSVIAGQLTGALVYDLLLPVGDNTLTWQIVAGVLLTFVAVYIGSMRRPGQVLR